MGRDGVTVAQRWLALVLVLLLGVAACTSNGKTDAPAAPAEQPPVADKGAPTPGGTLRVALPSAPVLDPALADEPAEVIVAELLFTPLVGIELGTGALRPGVAGTWTADEAQQRFTFQLRDSARFSDGSPITSGDVKATLERVTNPATASPLASLLEPVASIETPTPASVVVVLSRPLSTLPWVLSDPGLGIAPAAALADSAAFAAKPTGSGPFRVKSVEGTTVTLEKVPDGTAYVDTVRLFVPDGGAAGALTAVTQDKADVSLLSRERAIEATQQNIKTVKAPYLAVGSYGLNTRSPNLADPRLRHAIIRAIDPTPMVARAYGPSASVPDGLIARGVDGATTGACAQRCNYDPAVSRSILALAFPDGNIPPVYVDFDESAVQRVLAETLRDQLSAVGIPTFLRPHTFEEYDQFLAAGTADIFRLGWVADYPSALAFLSPLFVPGAGENVTGMNSPAVTDALGAAERAADAAVRNERLAAAERGVLDAFVVAPIVQFNTTLAIGAAVRGAKVNVFGGFEPGEIWLQK